MWFVWKCSNRRCCSSRALLVDELGARTRRGLERAESNFLEDTLVFSATGPGIGMESELLSPMVPRSPLYCSRQFFDLSCQSVTVPKGFS